MKNLKYLILIILLISSALADGTGRITGRIIDRQTKEPLAGVNVSLLLTSLGSSSGEDGRFLISNVPEGTHRLEFTYAGYQKRVVSDIPVTSVKAAIVNIQLIEEIYEGEKIIVTAGYFSEETQVQPGVFSLSREEIRRFPGGFEDVVRTVSTLPGVAINVTGGRNDLLVRGGGPSENLYVINNIEIPNINHFGGQGTGSGSLSFLNLDFVNNVSFSTGGFSVDYGDKMSSVLELTMTEGRSDRIGGKLLLSATQFGLNGEGPLGNNGNFIVSARKSYLDLIFKAAGLPFIPVYTDYNVLLNFQPTNRDRIVLLGLAAVDRVERDQSSQENRVTNSGILGNSQNQFIAGMDYRHLLNSGYINLTTSWNLNQFRLNQKDENEIDYFNSRADEQELNLKLQHFTLMSKKLGIKTGLSQKFIFSDNQSVFADSIFDRNGKKLPVEAIGVSKENFQNISASKSALFFEAEWFANKNVTVKSGFRADYFSFLEQPLYIAPRMALKYQISPRFQLKTSGGVYYQSPSYVWLVNRENRYLKALENKMIVAGFDYLLREDTRVSLETYYKRYDNLPSGAAAGLNDYLVITNTGTSYGGRDDDFQSFGYFPLKSSGDGYAYGFEWLVQKRFSDIPLYGQMSFSYARSGYKAENGKIYPGQYDQRVIFNISSGYIFNKKWEMSGKFRYFTGIPYTPVYRPSENNIQPGSVQNLPDEYLSGRLAPAHHLDLRVDRYFNFPKWMLIIFVDIQNIYNFKIPSPPEYDFWEDKIVTASNIGILPSIGISFEY